MSDCCYHLPSNQFESRDKNQCPQDGTKGQAVQLITLKSLLKPRALEQLNSQTSYRFCNSSDCSVVYFSADGQIFTTNDVQVPVFQKHGGETVPVCYCFGWTRQALRQEMPKSGIDRVLSSIQAHMKAKRCGCEVNNPQGSCCLGNVQLMRKSPVTSD